MIPHALSNIRSKMLFLVAGILTALLSLDILLLRNLHHVAATADEITTDIIPIAESFYRSRLALQKSLRALNEAVIEVNKPEEADKIRVYEGRLRTTMINFDMFIKAIAWGTESDAFRTASGGLTYAEWHRQEPQNRLMCVKKAPADIQQFAGQADLFYADFSANALKALKSHRKALRLELEGQLESAGLERRQREIYRENAKKYFESIEDIFRRMDEASDRHVAETIARVHQSQSAIFLWAEILLALFVVLIIGFCLVFVELVIVRPVQALAQGTQKIGEGDLGTRVKISSNDEIGRLAGMINRMAEGLEKSTVSREYLERVLESANDAFISIDESGCIISWNRIAEKMFGWPRRDVTGKLLVETIIPPQYREAHTRGLKRFLETKEGPVLGKTVELPALHRDAGQFSVELTIWPIQTRQGYQFNAFLRDITERKKTEGQLRDTYMELAVREKSLRQMFGDLQATHEELKGTQLRLIQSEKLASIGQLAAGVAHEINNPVGFIANNLEMFQSYIQSYLKIMGMTESLEKEIDNGNLERARALVDGMRKFEKEIKLDYINKDVTTLLEQSLGGAERIKKIVVDLKTFVRADMAETIESVQIEEIIDSTLGILHNEIKYKAELIKDYGNTPLVKGNPPRLGQVFLNLLVNATQAIEEKGKITVKTYCQNGYLCVDVADTGKGIPPESIAKIFEPFFTTKPVGQGTGLGLSISYEIIQGHGGEIKVRSELGKGTTFTVMLPLS